MPMDAGEFNALMLSDKRIEGNINWHEDQDKSQSARIFRTDVITDDERSMFVQGRYTLEEANSHMRLFCAAKVVSTPWIWAGSIALILISTSMPMAQYMILTTSPHRPPRQRKYGNNSAEKPA